MALFENKNPKTYYEWKEVEIKAAEDYNLHIKVV